MSEFPSFPRSGLGYALSWGFSTLGVLSLLGVLTLWGDSLSWVSGVLSFLEVYIAGGSFVGSSHSRGALS